jgi:hypothetical protein
MKLKAEKCPRIDVSKRILLGGEEFSIGHLLGQGGFAKVFKASSGDSKICAIKV